VRQLCVGGDWVHNFSNSGRAASYRVGAETSQPWVTASVSDTLTAGARRPGPRHKLSTRSIRPSGLMLKEKHS
jgi:hypothetical protein